MKEEEKMIYEEYHGKPYAIVFGICLVAIAGIFCFWKFAEWVVNLIFG